MKRRGVEDLLAPRLLAHYADARLPVDEGTVTGALSPVWVPDMERAVSGGEGYLEAMLRTGVIFVMNEEDTASVIQPLEEARDTPWDGLPPLPYPRIWIEAGSKDSPEPAPFLTAVAGELRPELHERAREVMQRELESSRVWGFAITGTAKSWYVFRLGEIGWDTPEPDYVIHAFHIEANGTATPPLPPFEPMDEARPDGWWPILLVHAIDALGARTVALDVPRPHRRAYQRRFGVEHPKVYFVDLKAAGETELGHGDREYHVRWMVRGHWRTLSSGGRTWVRPYVKGPAGAPWKGRPVYARQDSK